MPYLQTHLKTLDFSNQLNVVKNLIETAQAKTTFWGSRIVKINGFTGSVYLDDLAEKILKAGEQRSDADDLSLAERIDGIEITKKLENLYRITDTQIRNSNLLTKLLNWIREFASTFFHNTRFRFEDRCEPYFRGYSETKFLQQFGGAFDNRWGDHPATDGGYFQRITAKEDLIRAHLIKNNQ